MTCNIGNRQRILRAVVGLALVSLVFVGPQTLWGLVGLLPLASAALGRCPPGAIFGDGACGIKDRNS